MKGLRAKRDENGEIRWDHPAWQIRPATRSVRESALSVVKDAHGMTVQAPHQCDEYVFAYGDAEGVQRELAVFLSALADVNLFLAHYSPFLDPPGVGDWLFREAEGGTPGGWVKLTEEVPA